MEKPAQDRRDRVRATRQPPVPAQKSRAFPRENGTEIIEEFPLVFGFADWPTFLIGPSIRRGRAFPPDLHKAVIDAEVSAFLLSDAKRRKSAKAGA
jgi:hypothetical protein